MSPATGVSPAFDRAFNKVVLQIEGGEAFTDLPNDSGGATRWGVTEATARRCGYTGTMASMPMVVAKDIYRAEFWDTLHLDSVCFIAGYAVAEELFEQNVNLPFSKAAKGLQHALNAFNKRTLYYPDVMVDGQVGDKTLNALRAFMKHRKGEGAVVLLRALNSQQGAHYLYLAEARQKDEDFVYGWFLHRVS